MAVPIMSNPEWESVHWGIINGREYVVATRAVGKVREEACLWCWNRGGHIKPLADRFSHVEHLDTCPVPLAQACKAAAQGK